MFSLSYLSGAERLTIVIMKARNLNLIGVGNKKSYPGNKNNRIIILDYTVFRFFYRVLLRHFQRLSSVNYDSLCYVKLKSGLTTLNIF